MSDEHARATIGVTGLAVMGRNLARNLARNGYTVAVHNRTTRTALLDDFGDEGDFVRASRWPTSSPPSRSPAPSSSWSRPAAPTDAVIDELVPLLEPGDIDRRRRQRPLRRHPPPRAGAARARPALRRHGRLRRRGGRAPRPVDHAGRLGGGVRRPLGPMFEKIAARRGRHALLRPHRPRRRRPLREDGPQRHRVRRHAAHRRGLRPAARRARRRARREIADIFRDLEHRRPRVVPHRDHRRRARPHRRRAPARRSSTSSLRPGRAEGHRPLDRAERPRPGRADHRHRRGDLRPLAVRPRRPARRGPRGLRRRPGSSASVVGPRPVHRGRARSRSTPRRSSRTRRASTTSRPAARSTAGTSTSARSPRSGAAAASSGPGSSTASGRRTPRTRPDEPAGRAVLRRRGRTPASTPGAAWS